MRTVYREKGGQIEKRVIRTPGQGDYVAPDFHENINRTYYQLECDGQLRDMGPRQKKRIRDLHRYAQDSAYWD